MSIEFLKISPEQAVLQLRELIEEGYKIYNGMRADYTTLPDETARRAKMPIWQSSVNAYYGKCQQQLLSIFMSSLYWDEFTDTEILDASFGEIPDFTNMRRHLRIRVQTLRKNYDFVIQHSNASFTVEGDLVFNAARDINSAPNGAITTTNDTD